MVGGDGGWVKAAGGLKLARFHSIIEILAVQKLGKLSSHFEREMNETDGFRGCCLRMAMILP